MGQTNGWTYKWTDIETDRLFSENIISDELLKLFATQNILRKSNAYPFVGILRSCQHVVYDAVHVGNKTIHANFEQHDNCPTYILSHYKVKSNLRKS